MKEKSTSANLELINVPNNDKLDLEFLALFLGEHRRALNYMISSGLANASISEVIENKDFSKRYCPPLLIIVHFAGPKDQRLLRLSAVLTALPEQYRQLFLNHSLPRLLDLKIVNSTDTVNQLKMQSNLYPTTSPQTSEPVADTAAIKKQQVLNKEYLATMLGDNRIYLDRMIILGLIYKTVDQLAQSQADSQKYISYLEKIILLDGPEEKRFERLCAVLIALPESYRESFLIQAMKFLLLNGVITSFAALAKAISLAVPNLTPTIPTILSTLATDPELNQLNVRLAIDQSILDLLKKFATIDLYTASSLAIKFFDNFTNQESVDQLISTNPNLFYQIEALFKKIGPRTASRLCLSATSKASLRKTNTFFTKTTNQARVSVSSSSTQTLVTANTQHVPPISISPPKLL
jgi:hypothetical protein